MVLGEVADRGFVSPDDFAVVNKRTIVAACFAQLGFRRRWGIGEQRVQQRSFSRAVASHQRDPFAPCDAGGKVANYELLVIRFPEVLDFQNVLSRRPLLLELDERALNVGPGKFRHLQALDFFAPRLHLAGTGSGGESCDEFVQLRNLLLALRVLRFNLRAHLRLGDDHVVIRAGVGDDRFVVDIGNVGTDAVQEMAVVRDGNDYAIVGIEEALQPVDRIQVEVVRGLVEQKGLRMAEESLREQHADFLSALQFAHFARLQVFGDIQTLEKDRSVALGGVPIFFAHDTFELPELHAIFIGHVMLGVDAITLLQRSPEALVAHDDGVEHRKGIKRELILAQHSELARADDRALLRVQFAAEQLHKRGFPGAIRPGQTVPFPRCERGGNFFKQNLRAVAHRYIAD